MQYLRKALTKKEAQLQAQGKKLGETDQRFKSRIEHLLCEESCRRIWRNAGGG